MKVDYIKECGPKNLIGKGAFGEVYNLNNRAIKIFRLNEIKNELKEKYFTDEITDEINEEFKKIIKGITNEFENMKICSYNNNYSVKCYDYFQDENILGIVMELCDTDLKGVLKKKKDGFNVKEIYEIMYQLNKTFKIMNENKIVHRDLKLDNILIKYEKNNILDFICKLTDYGISKKLNDLTICKTYAGTTITMAPEILKNEEENKEYSNKCDLWSIGVIIYVLLFKRPPYSGEKPNAILNQIKKLGQRILEKTGYDKLDDLISKLLIEDPIKRISWNDYYNHPFFKDEIILRYKTDEKKEKKILGKEFVEQNGNICYIMLLCIKIKNMNYQNVLKLKRIMMIK